MGAAGDFDYDAHGDGYERQRRADPRIAACVWEALGDARTVLNVGAGAGSYEPRDRYVLAIEPSRGMRAQRPRDAALAIAAIAEDLPLDDRSVDASMATVTIHQWKDVSKGLHELLRVTRGSIVILTFEGKALERYWIRDYAPEMIAAERRRFPSLAMLRSILESSSRHVSISSVPIPIDCTDGFLEAYYARPERLLDPTVRRAQSSWGFVTDDVQGRCVRQLSDDLRSGAWDERNGPLRSQSSYDGALRLIVSKPRD